MIFNSIIYLFFLAVVAIVYYTFPGKYRWIWLLIASIGYYLSFIPVFLSLIVLIIIINYFLARWLANSTQARSNLIFLSIVVINILVLAIFKYFNNIFPDFELSIYQVDFFFRTDPVKRLILPLGLSYLVFTVLSYQIEIKRKTINPENHPGYFSLYLLFFPKIAQGPIERPQQFIPQLYKPQPLNYDLIIDGFKLILWGYFKKLVVADRLAIYVNAVYNNSEHHNGNSLIVATIFFTFQIYADFSGYTDIALGSARVLGFNLTNNFKRPYLATSITEFWNRWHITFSQWLRDYIFLPTAYTLSGKLRKERYFHIETQKWIYFIVIILTFSICGIWHGVGWTYLVWGLLFGVFLTIGNWTKDFQKKSRKKLHIKKNSGFYQAYSIVITFILVAFAWIFFRADSLTQANSIIGKIVTSRGALFYKPTELVFAFIGIASLIVVDIKQEYFNEKFKLLHSRYVAVQLVTIVILIIAILLLGVLNGGQFIYFQF